MVKAAVMLDGRREYPGFLPQVLWRTAENLINPLLVRSDNFAQADACIGFELLNRLGIRRRFRQPRIPELPELFRGG